MASRKKTIIIYIIVAALSICAALYALGVISFTQYIIWDDGHSNIYEGYIKNGAWTGDVKIFYADGAKYIGPLEEGQFSGYGEYISAEGLTIRGEFAGGQLKRISP